MKKIVVITVWLLVGVVLLLMKFMNLAKILNRKRKPPQESAAETNRRWREWQKTRKKGGE